MSTLTEESRDFDFIIDLIYERSRIRLHDGKKPLIQARLGKRMRHHGFQTLSEYCHFLRNSADENEIVHVVNALTTNFTHFLREESHFKFLVEQALPRALQGGQKRFHLWSAACATGEEPCSLALYLAESYPLEEGWDWRITATDISTKALATAQQGIYSNEKLQGIPQEWVRRHFQRGTNRWEGHCRIKPALSSRIRFQHLNLLGNYPFQESFEIIFCRNVMIYFDRPTQEQLVNKLHTRLCPYGFLVVGHSESLTGISMRLKQVKPSVYQNCPPS